MFKKVKNTKIYDYIVDTCLIPGIPGFDSDYYETGVCKNDTWIIVETYLSEFDAQYGHKKWVDKIKKNLPEALTDIFTGFKKF